MSGDGVLTFCVIAGATLAVCVAGGLIAKFTQGIAAFLGLTPPSNDHGETP